MMLYMTATSFVSSGQRAALQIVTQQGQIPTDIYDEIIA